MIETTPSLTFSEAINSAASKFFEFKGRSRRSEFWWAQLVVYLAMTTIPPLGFILSLATIPLTFRRLHDTGRSGWWWGIGVILNLAFWGTIIDEIVSMFVYFEYYPEYGSLMSSNAILFGFLGLIAVIYNIVLIIICCLDSQPFENEYGESPKHIYKEL